jgi:hypothetical protein
MKAKALAFLLIAGSAMAATNDPLPRLGINLAGPADWNTELPFVDVFRMSRRWVSQETGQPWGKGPELALDAHGWVTRLASNCWAETPLCNTGPGHYPSGDYTVLYDGEGRIDFWGGAATIVSNAPGKLTVRVDAGKGAFHLRLRATNPTNYVRNIRVFMPGKHESQWSPVFLNRWRGVACIRFMDWMETNNSKIRRWAERPTLADATFSDKGVALEWMIDLCNRLNCDAWFCLPHLADEDYQRQFAGMVKARLDPKLKVYVEYSNEVWNRQFGQHQAAGNYAQRCAAMFAIGEKVFGGRDRLVRVLASQAASAYVTGTLISSNADVLAIAPYLGMSVGPDERGLTVRDVERWSVDQVLDYVERTALPKAVERIREQKKLADRYGLRLVAYEGGQHLVGVRGGENNDAVTKLFLAANAHPRMGELYSRYLDSWTKEGGDLFCHFSSVGRWGKYGSWGLLQYADDDPAQSPKFMAVMRWANLRSGQSGR